MGTIDLLHAGHYRNRFYVAQYAQLAMLASTYGRNDGTVTG